MHCSRFVRRVVYERGQTVDPDQVVFSYFARMTFLLIGHPLNYFLL